MTFVSFNKNFLLFFCICITVIFFQITASVAADIRRSNSPECLIVLDGIIEKGDYRKFRDLADKVFPNFDADSTIRHLLCLNSPGGSFSEGVLFATHFLEKGVGTVIRANESCTSVCAIMFMMGSHIGPELAGLNRKLHLLGSLGFHRPYVPSKYIGLVEAENIVLAFDGAFSSALDLLALANKKAPWSSDPMIKSDLIQSMLNHRKDDFFLIDTIDKAGRWDIELLGMSSVFGSALERVFYACENMLQWQNVSVVI